MHVHDIGFRTAPYYASRILADVDAAQLEEMYSRVFQACVTENTAKSFDFVQQILYRLAKGRHFTFLEEEKSGKDGKDFAEGLYRSISAKVIEHCCSSESVSTVCSWAAIAARLNRIDQARTLCERLISLPTAGPLRGNHFVNLAFTQGALLSSMNSTEKSARSDTRDVVDKCLKLLASSFEYALANASQGHDELPRVKGSKAHRVNEIVHTYLEVLFSEDIEDAERIVNDINLETGSGFDALTLSMGAKILAKRDDPAAAERLFRKALNAAEQECSIRKAPDRLISVTWSYVKFLKNQRDVSYDEEMMARFTKMLELLQQWPTGWPGERRANACEQYVIYLTRCQYKILRKYAPRLQSLIFPVLQCSSEHGRKVIGLIEEELMRAERRNHQYWELRSLLGEEHEKWRRRSEHRIESNVT